MATSKFYCTACQHKMTWKQEFAGRRIKCKHCGQGMAIPPEPASSEPASSKPALTEPVEDDLYALSDLASDAHAAAASLPPTIVEALATPAPSKKTPKAAKSGQSAIPLAYRQGAMARDVAAAKEKSLIDPNRDLYVPLGLILVGTVLYIGYYAIHYDLGGSAMVATSIGLTIMTILETAVLFGFALVIAGPLGVSFGGIGTALLKLAAIAVFCDGSITWVDGLFSKYAGNMGGGGILSFGVIGFPVALGVYWTMLIYLFSMDPGDSWMVVVILAIFYRVLRMVLLLLLLKFILSFGGISGGAIGLPSFGGSAAVENPVIDEINEAKAQNVLHEAKQYATDNGRRAEMGTIDACYAAGAPNVWFQTSRDIDGKGDAFRMVVELPKDATARTKCYDAAKAYFKNNGDTYSAQALQDNGDPYLMIDLPGKNFP